MRWGLLGMLILCVVTVHAQDTIRLSLPEAENQFLQKNLSLLAEKYNIDIAKALVVQARLYTNPNFSVTGNIYNQQQKKLLDVSNQSGEYIIAVQQLIRVAGKRNKEIKLAETSTKLSENRFFDLLRTLRFSLRSNFYSAYYLQNSINAYQVQIISLIKLNESYEALKIKGVVTVKDAIRIKSLLYSLKAEQTGLQNQLNDVEAELQILLQDNKTRFTPVMEKNDGLSASFKQMNLTDLIDTAYQYRFDLKLAENTLLYNQQNLALQKLVLEGLALTGVETVLELHAGSANFTIPVAMRAKQTHGVESHPRAVEHGVRNIAQARLQSRARLVKADADDLRAVKSIAGGRVDAILLDPPRTGAPGIAKIAEEMKPRRIVYVSCNPATLARDLAQLRLAGYSLQTIQSVDLFPRTWHVEAVAVLQRRGDA